MNAAASRRTLRVTITAALAPLADRSDAALEEYVPTRLVRLLLEERARHYVASPPGADWNGVHALSEK